MRLKHLGVTTTKIPPEKDVAIINKLGMVIEVRWIEDDKHLTIILEKKANTCAV